MNAIQTLLTDHLDIWTAADTEKKSGRGRSSGNADRVYGIKKLRELILELAVRGKLVPQDAGDEPASALLKRIQAEKAKLIAESKIKKDKPLPQINEEEKPYALPLSWEWIRLPEIYFSISPSGSKLLSSAIKDAGTFPVVDQGQRYIAGYTDDAALLINLPGPVIVFGDHTTERKYIDFDFVAGADGVKILRPILQDEHFFFRQLQGYRLEERGYARHFKVLNDNLYALPPIEEQHRIVAKVDELMAMCGQLEQQQTHSIAAHQTLCEALLGTLTRAAPQQEFSAAWARIASHFDTLFTTEASIDQLKQTILQLAVMGKLVPQDPNDEPASVLLKRITIERTQLVEDGEARQKRDLPDIGEDETPYMLPKGWEWVRLGQIISISSGDGLTSANMKSDGGIPVYGGNGINGYHDKANIMKPTLVIGRVGYYCGSIHITPESAWVTDNAFVTTFSEENIYLGFLYWLLRGTNLKENENATAQPVISGRKVYPIVVGLPPKTEQHRIVAKVDELMALCDALKARLADAQAIQLHLADAIVEQAVC